MANPLKVAMLTSEGGGIYSVSMGLAEALSKQGVQTTIFLSSRSSRTSKKVNSNLQIHSLPIFNYPPKAIWFLLSHYRHLPKLVREFDIVHAVNPELGMAYTFCKYDSNKPLVTTLHGCDRAYLKAFMEIPTKNWTKSDFAFHAVELPLHELATKRCVDKSKKVVVPSMATLNELTSYNALKTNKMTTIANGINFEEIESKPSKSSENNNPVLIYAGRLFWMKGITFVLEAFCELKKRNPNLRLRIFGRGPLEKEVMNYIKTKKLENSVYFGGFLPHEKLLHELKQADIVLFPSLYESQPIFALEAMACKKPIVAFNIPSIHEIIEDNKTGLLAKKERLKDLCYKTSMVLDDKHLRQELGQNAYEYVHRHHDWNKQVKKYIQVYEGLTS
jgi:glycosyltransferase involved in cell wall biosynthesis